MAERRVEVRPFGVRYMCDACKQGEMMALSGPQAIVQEAGKILVRHVCNVCRTMASFAEKYPTVRYEDVEVHQGYQQPQNNGYQQPSQQNMQPQQNVQQPPGTQVVSQHPNSGT